MAPSGTSLDGTGLDLDATTKKEEPKEKGPGCLESFLANKYVLKFMTRMDEITGVNAATSVSERFPGSARFLADRKKYPKLFQAGVFGEGMKIFMYIVAWFSMYTREHKEPINFFDPELDGKEITIPFMIWVAIILIFVYLSTFALDGLIQGWWAMRRGYLLLGWSTMIQGILSVVASLLHCSSVATTASDVIAAGCAMLVAGKFGDQVYKITFSLVPTVVKDYEQMLKDRVADDMKYVAEQKAKIEALAAEQEAKKQAAAEAKPKKEPKAPKEKKEESTPAETGGEEPEAADVEV